MNRMRDLNGTVSAWRWKMMNEISSIIPDDDLDKVVRAVRAIYESGWQDGLMEARERYHRKEQHQKKNSYDKL